MQLDQAIWNWDVCVPVREWQAVGVTLGQWRDTGWYCCLQTASEMEVQRYQREYTTWRAEQEKSRRFGPLILCAMPALSEWDKLLRAVRARTEQADDGAAIVSVVFCHPQSVVFHDLKRQYAYLNHRSGPAWDLYFIGYKCVSPGNLPPAKAGVPLWFFLPKEFNSIRQNIEREHLSAIRSSQHNPAASLGWRYCGRPEMVSFMAYRDYPGLIDWLSLRAVHLVDANGNYLALSLSEVVEVLSDWRHHDSQVLRDLAPGEPPAVMSAQSIGKALGATAAVLAAGIAGNAAYDLINSAIN